MDLHFSCLKLLNGQARSSGWCSIMSIAGISPLRNGSSTEFPHDLLKEVAASKRQFHSKLLFQLPQLLDLPIIRSLVTSQPKIDPLACWWMASGDPNKR